MEKWAEYVRCIAVSPWKGFCIDGFMAEVLEEVLSLTSLRFA